jgi:addiction module HigA family antidote
VCFRWDGKDARDVGIVDNHLGEPGMSIPRRHEQRGAPLHPGEMLREDFLKPLGMTAEEIRAPERRVVAIVKERRGLDADMCLRLGRFFRMTAEFWMNLEKDYELEAARKDWPGICKEVRISPRDGKSGELRVRTIR